MASGSSRRDGHPRIWRWIPILLIFRINGQISCWLLSPLLVDMGWGLDRNRYRPQHGRPFVRRGRCGAEWNHGEPLQWSLTGISAMVGGGLAMACAEFIGYSGVLVISFGIVVISIVLIWF